ncbi:Non-specific serine/threonine protein kinase protein [Dioscorea alata]|uniref:Non-specific serine/threonine protein kinase protein n=3 Tax=Dioscorea alata TaxID=55571 RepID=A0ACB7UEH5_DIOAL|nr:Non-specific serine/threonine protein kinase protein [Dioscorea alata]KAH7658726.1 Non-specific serine/threonine protein kinase protein [Dioscorea alata]KAH7658727.1 Non-specific serine/threonine protein kinase protein [Dioscorea alata]
MEHEVQKRFPANPKEYKLYEEVGEGVSATVYRALCVPLNEIVAIKVLDLEKCNNDLDGIRREVQTMSLIDHPNVLRAYCSFPADRNLWIVMPYMAGGSCLHIIKSDFPEGFEEPIIATLLREVLKALVYLHGHGHIHRDVKAGNILVDANGAVKLADFGVSACMFDTGDRQRSRNTFVGTPCWMAPEVMQQLHGYDFKADIWSFGITALELAHGHAPFSKYPPMKVLLMTLQNAPPGLDYERDKRFSKSFRELVAACLVKDPKKRPSSEKLLKHPFFFKHARSNEYLKKTILDGLAPLGDRFRALKGRESSFLLQNQAINEDKEHLSQREYIRGISGWNFNLEDLKTQAALLDEIHTKDLDKKQKSKDSTDDYDGYICTGQTLSSTTENHGATPKEDGLEDLQDLEGPFSSAFSGRPLQALKACFDVCEDDIDATSPNLKDPLHLSSELISQKQQLSQVGDLETRKVNGENLGKSYSVPKNINVLGRQKFSSGSLVPELVHSSSNNIAGDVERGDSNQKQHHERNYSGPLLYRQIRDFAAASGQEESLEGRLIQRKGRFKVTSADVNAKVASVTNSISNQVGVAANYPVNTASLLPTLHFLLQQNALQREQLVKLIKCVEQSSSRQSETPSVDAGTSEASQPFQAPTTTSRERELQTLLSQLQQSVGSLAEDVQKLKVKNSQLERQIGAFAVKGGKFQSENEAQRSKVEG